MTWFLQQEILILLILWNHISYTHWLSPASIIFLQLHFINPRDNFTETCSHLRFIYILQPGDPWQLISYDPWLKNPSTRDLGRQLSGDEYCCSFRGPGFDFFWHHLLASKGTWHARSVRHTCKQNIHLHKIKINLKKKPKSQPFNRVGHSGICL